MIVNTCLTPIYLRAYITECVGLSRKCRSVPILGKAPACRHVRLTPSWDLILACNDTIYAATGALYASNVTVYISDHTMVFNNTASSGGKDAHGSSSIKRKQ